MSSFFVSVFLKLLPLFNICYLGGNNFQILLPSTVNVAEDDTVPRKFLALHVYNPLSCDITSTIIRPSRDWNIRLSAGRLEFSFSHVTWGAGFPLTSHCNEAIPVSFTTIDTRGNTMEGAEMDSPGSPLGPWGPWSPLGPGGPWFPWAPLSPFDPCSPRGPGGPCLPGWPGLPLCPLGPLGHFTGQASLPKAIVSPLTSSGLTGLPCFETSLSFPAERLWRVCNSSAKK